MLSFIFSSQRGVFRNVFGEVIEELVIEQKMFLNIYLEF